VIPLPALGAIPWRLIGWVAIVAAVAFAGWRVSAWKASHEALPAVRDALEAEVECKAGSTCEARQRELQEAAQAKTIEVVNDYEAELAALRSRPVRTVRVCPDSGDMRHARAAGPADGAGPGSGVIPGAAGRDIGPDLYQLARDADEVAARLRALQDWNRALAAPTKRAE